MKRCRHGQAIYCRECVDAAEKEIQPDEVMALLKAIVTTTTVIMECMANQTARLERIEAQLAERQTEEGTIVS